MNIEINHTNLGILIDAIDTAIKAMKIGHSTTYIENLERLRNCLQIEHSIRQFEIARDMHNAAKQYRTTLENPLTGEVHS